ncbi:beta-ketoacyl-ACP reductase [Shewanella sp. NFH-SH190041]|uniref:SDR family oxidoreductase n=1 Tax=Shewanella sp. NFH-SH190041 TaxID=2950245 RepID=UPI0021C441E4|nr:SDR family oxidoreductase [Shewanella sp. NFH-SH190041]BDM64040.1 beta-ketoacyl-ACP reductase [Shewanella sp. NFH-SH190041]
MQKLALITGAKGGIGSAITKQLVKDGIKIIATYSKGQRETAQAWFDEAGFTSTQVILFEMDITDSQHCREQLFAITEQYGVIDILINNAGITRDCAFKKMSAEQWHQVINTNLNSLFNVTQPLFAAMCEKGGGRIINISSVNGLKGQFGQTNYSAAKAGMIGFSKALALEGARSGVTVNVVAPGYTATPMVQAIRQEVLDNIVESIPLKRLATPEEIATAVSYLAGEGGAYITGETLSLNGGLYMH